MWHLLWKYALTTEFSAVWVDRLGLDEVGHRVGADVRDARHLNRDELADELFHMNSGEC